MKKTELLIELKAKTFCDALVGKEEIVSTHVNGDKVYQQTIRDIDGKACVYRTITFYVIDEGKVGEKALYKDTEPKTELNKVIEV